MCVFKSVRLGLIFSILAGACPAAIRAQETNGEPTNAAQADAAQQPADQGDIAQTLQAIEAKNPADAVIVRGLGWFRKEQCAKCHFSVPGGSSKDAIDKGIAFTFDGRKLCTREAEQKETAKAAFLGVTLGVVPPAVRRHVRLPSDMGLLIEAIDPDSPAQKAGIEKFDILEKINQQLLVNQEQFSVLMRTFAPRSAVTLVIIHEGQAKTVATELAEREVAQTGDTNARGQFLAAGTLLAQVADMGNGVVTADFDNDGFADLYVTSNGQNHLYHNQGDGKFADVSVSMMGLAARNAAQGDGQPAMKKVPVTYLGVSTSAPSAALAGQLKLAAGTGLMIDTVDADSPAAAAGLKQFDVLEKIEDQLLVNADQLTVLIRSFRPSQAIKLTVIREGQRQIVPVTLGQHEIEVSADTAIDAHSSLAGDQYLTLSRWLAGDPRKLSAAFVDVEGANKWEVSVAGDDASTDDATFLRRTFLDVLGVPPQAEELKSFAEDQRPEKRKFLVDELLARPEAITKFNGATSAQWSDREHSLTLTSKLGHARRLLAKDRDGKVVFDGPVETDQERQQVPGEIGVKLQWMVEGLAHQGESSAGSAGEQVAQQALRQVLPKFELSEIPLAEAIEAVRKQTGANIVVNWKAIKAAGLDAREPITLSLHDVRLASVLKTMLALVDGGSDKLSVTSKDEVILISTAAGTASGAAK